MAEPVAHAHAAGAIHRGLKPGDAAQAKLVRGTTEMEVTVTVGGV